MTIDLCTDDELVRAPFKRYDPAIFVASSVYTTENDQEVFRAKGNRRLCQGLCQGAISIIDRVHHDKARTVQEEEEG